MNLANLLRIANFAEGLSLLALLGVAMPLKYFADMPGAVSTVGMIHGVLFMGFILVLFQAASAYEWPMKKMALLFLSACVPFGFLLARHQIEETA